MQEADWVQGPLVAGWALLVVEMKLEQEQVEAGCSVLRPSWGCTCSRGAATCAAPSAGPALCSNDLSPRHSAASIAQTVPAS